jgi:hypothetical protein
MPWAMAAAMLLTLGFAALAGLLAVRLERQGSRLAALEQRFGWFEQVTGDDQLAALQASVRFLSSRGMAACGLDPMSPDQPDARGTVYMNPAEGRWMLAARNLAPAPPGRLYRIWFVTDSGPINGGSFRVEDGHGRIEIGAQQVPPGLQAISITLEPVEAGDVPGGAQILYGNEARQIL